MSEVIVTREHLAGLELAFCEAMKVTGSIPMQRHLKYLITQASAAPEQEPAYVVPCSVGWYGYSGGYVYTKYAPDVWKVVEHRENLLDAIPTEPLYAHPSAEIERLRAENAELSAEVGALRAEGRLWHSKSRLAEVKAEKLSEKLAEAQALLREIRAFRWVAECSEHRASLERQVDLWLSASAQPAEVKS